MQKWEYAELEWTSRWTLGVPGGDGDDAADDGGDESSQGTLEFSDRERETQPIRERTFWDAMHQLGQDGWELVATNRTRVSNAAGGNVTTQYTFKRPVPSP